MVLSSEELKKQLGLIGISLSGGGFRAAAFHLGTIDYLNRVNLLPNVQILSTVSGGTFTGAKYVLSKREHQSFDEYFQEYYRFLKNVEIVKDTLDALGKGRVKTPSQRMDMIVAAAQVYANTFLKDNNGDPILFQKILNDPDNNLGTLQEIIFNATEFRYGLAFRFQKSEKGLIGNYYLHMTQQEAEHMRLADIVAASSCFPGGFEPLAFPDDFVWNDDSTYRKVKERLSGPFGIMDGGIYDNQGIESMLLADGRDDYNLGMIIISDSDRQSDDLYPYPRSNDKSFLKYISLGMVKLFMILMIVLCFLTVGVVSYNWYYNGGDIWNVFVFAIPCILALGTGISLTMLYSFIKSDVLPMIPQSGSSSWKDFKKLNLAQLRTMILLRATSLLTLTSDVFMKRIRRLGYQSVFENPLYEKNRISNLVYHLMPGEKFDLPSSVTPPSDTIRNIAKIASTMNTTLWFEPTVENQQESVVACGQVTMCYNLMKYIYRKYDKDVSNIPEEIKPFWDRLNDDWNQMNADPFVFLRNRM